MSIGTILLIVLVIALLGGFSGMVAALSTGPGIMAAAALALLVIVLILVLLGRI